MASQQYIKSRLKAVKNIGQITKAMEVVAATKMRKAQEVALNSRPYGYAVLDLLHKLSHGAVGDSPLATARPIDTTLIVVIASDRGLAGAFNSQVFRAADKFFMNDVQEYPGHRYIFCTVGKKAHTYATRKGSANVKEFSGFGDYVHVEQIKPLAEFIKTGFLNDSWDRVVVASMHFRTTLKQDSIVRQLLPIDLTAIEQTLSEVIPEHGRFAGAEHTDAHDDTSDEYIIEPSPQVVFDMLMPHLVTMQLYQLILEANASEHSARRVAMKTASDNASELGHSLQLEYNKARQVGITNEIIEITSTMNTLT